MPPPGQEGLGLAYPSMSGLAHVKTKLSLWGFPPEPPVAEPQPRNGAQAARARASAAQRTLAAEHRSASLKAPTWRRRGNPVSAGELWASSPASMRSRD